MEYYRDIHCVVRNLRREDIAEIVREEIAQGWEASDEKYLKRLKDQEEKRCIALAAEYEGHPAGYINIYFKALSGPFASCGFPEIVDFGVLEKYRRHGTGTKLMEAAERIAFQYSETICIGVGLHSGYGSAQRMYVKRGYIPDGSGVWYQNAVCKPYESCRNDDDLVLYFSKKRVHRI